MSHPADQALQLAAKLAAGEPIDGAALEAIDPQQARGLRRLARIVARLDPAPIPCGTNWGPLQRLELAGQGSFGEVYRAFDPTLDRIVALKLRRADAPGTAGSGRDFVAEARRLARVRHPHVLAVHGAGFHSDRAGLWTDWIEGETLQSRLQQAAPLDYEQTLRIGCELASALAAVHDAGLVHGDVKVGNVMLDPQGHLVLMDFGAGFDSREDDNVLTAGTPQYLAPEVLRGEPVGNAIDMFACGVLLHRAAAGAYPQNGVAARRLQPRALRRLLQRLLAREPAARPSANELLEALNALRRAPLQRARRLAAAIGLTSLLAILVVTGLAYRRAESARRDVETALSHAATDNQFLQALLLHAAPDALGPQATMRELLDAAPSMVEQRYRARPADRMRLYELLATIEGDFANDETAARLWQAAADAAATDRANSDEYLRLRGQSLRWRAIAGDAVAALPEAEALLKRAQLESRPPRLIALLEFSLAEVETRAAQVHSTPDLNAQAIARLERVLQVPGRLDPRPESEALRRLAVLKLESGAEDEGKTLAERATQRAESALGHKHPLSALNRRILAWALMPHGGAARAEALFRSNLDMHQTKLGHSHRVVADDLVGLAYALNLQARYEEALPLAQDALRLTENLYGPAHRLRFDAGITLAEIYAGLGRPAQGVDVLQPLQQALRATRGSDNRQFVLLSRLHGKLLLDLGEPGRARAPLTDCVEAGTRALGAPHYLVLDCRALLGTIAAPPAASTGAR